MRGGHNALTHRKLKEFLRDCGATNLDLILYTEVRWLSKGKAFDRFFNLRADIVEFLKTNPIAESEEFRVALDCTEFLQVAGIIIFDRCYHYQYVKPFEFTVTR